MGGLYSVAKKFVNKSFNLRVFIFCIFAYSMIYTVFPTVDTIKAVAFLRYDIMI